MNHARMTRVALVAPALLVLCIVGLAAAASVTTPNTFVPNTPARADEVNANFSAHEAAINDNDSRIGALEGGKIAAPPGKTDVSMLGATVDATGTIITGGHGFTLTREDVGDYLVSFDDPVTWLAPSVTPMVNTQALHISSAAVTPTQLQIKFSDSAGNPTDSAFGLVILVGRD